MLTLRQQNIRERELSDVNYDKRGVAGTLGRLEQV